MAEKADEMKALKTAKKDLRERMRQSLSSISDESISSQSNKVRVHLLALPEYKKAARISIYLSMPKGEISTRTIVLDALEEGKRVFVPYIYTISSPAANGPKSVMNMVSLHSKKDYESLHPNAWGIPTPSKATISERLSCLGDDEITLDENLKQRKGDDSLHMVVMPGVAFDRGLARLGHGKGYYDFFISKLHQQAKAVNNEAETRMPFLVGLALKEQLLPPGQKIPMEESDWPVDGLIVGDGSIIRNKPGE